MGVCRQEGTFEGTLTFLIKVWHTCQKLLLVARVYFSATLVGAPMCRFRVACATALECPLIVHDELVVSQVDQGRNASHEDQCSNHETEEHCIKGVLLRLICPVTRPYLQ